MEHDVLSRERQILNLLKEETCIFDTPKYDDAIKAQNFFKELGCEIVVEKGPHYRVKVDAMSGNLAKLAARRVIHYKMKLTKWGEPR